MKPRPRYRLPGGVLLHTFDDIENAERQLVAHVLSGYSFDAYSMIEPDPTLGDPDQQYRAKRWQR
jgi:hypothetical protein